MTPDVAVLDTQLAVGGYVVDSTIIAHIREASDLTGIDLHYLLAKAGQESSFSTAARSHSSSATGIYQFTIQTWLDLMRRHGETYGYKDFADTIRRGRNGLLYVSNRQKRHAILDLRKEPRISALFAAEYASSNRDIMQTALRRNITSADLYLAHFMGPDGAVKLLKEKRKNPARPASEIFPRAAESNPRIFYNRKRQPRSVDQVYRVLCALFDRSFKHFTNLPVTVFASLPQVLPRGKPVAPLPPDPLTAPVPTVAGLTGGYILTPLPYYPSRFSAEGSSDTAFNLDLPDLDSRIAEIRNARLPAPQAASQQPELTVTAAATAKDQKTEIPQQAPEQSIQIEMPSAEPPPVEETEQPTTLSVANLDAIILTESEATDVRQYLTYGEPLLLDQTALFSFDIERLAEDVADPYQLRLQENQAAATEMGDTIPRPVAAPRGTVETVPIMDTANITLLEEHQATRPTNRQSYRPYDMTTLEVAYTPEEDTSDRYNVMTVASLEGGFQDAGADKLDHMTTLYALNGTTEVLQERSLDLVQVALPAPESLFYIPGEDGPRYRRPTEPNMEAPVVMVSRHEPTDDSYAVITLPNHTRKQIKKPRTAWAFLKGLFEKTPTGAADHSDSPLLPLTLETKATPK